jgi:hypothetical protein
MTLPRMAADAAALAAAAASAAAMGSWQRLLLPPHCFATSARKRQPQLIQSVQAARHSQPLCATAAVDVVVAWLRPTTCHVCSRRSLAQRTAHCSCSTPLPHCQRGVVPVGRQRQSEGAQHVLGGAGR